MIETQVLVLTAAVLHAGWLVTFFGLGLHIRRSRRQHARLVEHMQVDLSEQRSGSDGRHRKQPRLDGHLLEAWLTLLAASPEQDTNDQLDGLRLLLRHRLALDLPRVESRWLPFATRRLERKLRLAGQLPDEEMTTLLVAFAGSRRPRVATRSLIALGQGAPSHPGAVLPLADLLRESGPDSTVEIVWTLRRLLLVHPSFLGTLGTDPSSDVRRLTIEVADTLLSSGRAGDPSSCHRLIRAGLHDGTAQVRRLALRAAHHLQAHEHEQVLVAALDDTSLEIQTEAAGQLAAAVEGPRALDLAARIREAPTSVQQAMYGKARTLTGAPLEQVGHAAYVGPRARRIAALEMLGAAGRRGGAHAIVPHLDDAAPEIRRAAARALGSLARSAFPSGLDSAVTAILGRRLQDEGDVPTLAALAEALVYAGGRRAAGVLLTRIPSATSAQREHLVEALAVLGRLSEAARDSTRSETGRTP